MHRIAAILVVLVVALATAPLATAETVSATAPTQTATTGTAKTPATPTTGEATTTGGTTTGTSTRSKSPTESNTKSERGVAIAILVLGAVALGLAYLFYNGWRLSYEKLAGSALRLTDRFPKTEFNPVENAVFRVRGVAAQAAADQPVVEGPSGVAVGEPATFKANVAGQPAACTWTVEPPDSATVQPATGAETKLTALKEGAITLKAAVAGGAPTLVHLTALASAGEGGVPLLGVGFAGVAATIIAFTVAGALTALNIVSGTAFIAFLGPVVGYFFAAAHNSPGKGSESVGASGGKG